MFISEFQSDRLRRESSHVLRMLLHADVGCYDRKSLVDLGRSTSFLSSRESGHRPEDIVFHLRSPTTFLLAQVM
jgi:hypothetical protein